MILEYFNSGDQAEVPGMDTSAGARATAVLECLTQGLFV